MIKTDGKIIKTCTIDNNLVKKITVDDKAVIDTVSGLNFKEAFTPTKYASGFKLTTPGNEQVQLWGKYILKRETFTIDTNGLLKGKIEISIISAVWEKDICNLTIYTKGANDVGYFANIDISGNVYEEFTIGNANSGIYIYGDNSNLTLYIENNELKLYIDGNTAGLSQREYTLASVNPASYPIVYLNVSGGDQAVLTRDIYINARAGNQYIVGYDNPLI